MGAGKPAEGGADKAGWDLGLAGRHPVAVGGAMAAIVALAIMLRPVPVPVDAGVVSRGAMRVTVDEEGKTAVKEVYTVAAPLAGRLLRTPLHVGDAVEGNETVVAVIQPVAPAFQDERTRKELEALADGARSSVSLAEAEVRAAETELDWAKSELERSTALAKSSTVSKRSFERARLDVDKQGAELERARASLKLRRAELAKAEAQLIRPSSASISGSVPGECCVEVKSPQSGRVLRQIQHDETIVAPGQTLVEVGDTGDLEIEVELLSADAVKVVPGAAAAVEGAGLAAPLAARVRRVDPAGFTKVSALGIEEQRVKAILDFTGPKEHWSRLGHAFRVFLRITVWEKDDTLRVPLSALFRQGDTWSVFKIEEGRVRQVPVETGQRNADFAELLGGLSEGDRIVLHPSDRLSEGVRVEIRN